MKLLDRIALNRAIAIISSFILSLIKIFASKTKDEKPIIPLPKPPTRRRIRPKNDK